MILVEDTTKALGKLAAYWREQFTIPVVGVTGSCGKTTVRAMLESIFSQKGQTLASEKSYNNEIGVPLTLLKLTVKDHFAVVEMG
ncbi:MAG: UDP-N-acetylmuramoyl-tripeptide--D-alanyl-D-alanine ligase, partial [Alphaproteobacteria bacterium]|nr:UDP-N-acetylmuramoyl-tripeptide--D-alanyl-D-alanine ligase [Alphaproteobacteria bacterium]